MANLNMLKEAATSRREKRYVDGCINAEEYLASDLPRLRAKRKHLYQRLFSDHRRGVVRTFFWAIAGREWLERSLYIDDKIQEAKEAKNG